MTTSTVSPFLRPMIALPTGDSFESLRSAGFASADPTMKYSGRLLGIDVAEADDGTDRDDARVHPLLVDDLGVREALLELRDAVLEHHLLVLRVVVLRVLRDLAELAGSRDALRYFPAPGRSQHVQLARQLLVALGSEDHILHKTPPETRSGACRPRQRSRNGSYPATTVKTPPEYHPTAVIDLREAWRIGPVEVPTRLVLAPMAGVSVQAFRRQGRRYGAGLVCSEMVSCAGIEHRNEKTLGYLRVASDEHPLAIQLFGSDPGPMADAARMVEAVGADIVDVNFGCPVKEGDEDGRRRAPARGSGSRVPDRGGDRRRRRRPGDGEAPPRRAERLALRPSSSGRGSSRPVRRH